MTTPSVPSVNLEGAAGEGYVALLDSTGKANPVIKTNAGSVAVGQSLKTYTGKIALSAVTTTTVTLETVAAGKTFYITDLYLSHDSTTVIETRLQANGVDLFRAPVKGDTAPVSFSGIESQPNAPSGQQVTLLYPIVATTPNVYFFVSGFEQ